jgi:hypothetical protein
MIYVAVIEGLTSWVGSAGSVQPEYWRVALAA